MIRLVPQCDTAGFDATGNVGNVVLSFQTLLVGEISVATSSQVEPMVLVRHLLACEHHGDLLRCGLYDFRVDTGSRVGDSGGRHYEEGDVINGRIRRWRVGCGGRNGCDNAGQGWRRVVKTCEESSTLQ